MTRRTYSEAIRIPDYHERFLYLSLDGHVGESTFGHSRFMNQEFYKSLEWKRARRDILVRDMGMDMAHPDYPIGGRVIVHHIFPVTEQDIIERNPIILDPENLICVSLDTHNAIHFGDVSLLPKPFVERKPNDTIPWR